jgi:hypothetical protein
LRQAILRRFTKKNVRSSQNSDDNVGYGQLLRTLRRFSANDHYFGERQHLNIRFLFAFHSFLAYAHNMEVGGYNKEPDWVKIGPSLLVAASLVIAIRTAKWAANECSTPHLSSGMRRSNDQ